jgi:hypothetical protein
MTVLRQFLAGTSAKQLRYLTALVIGKSTTSFSLVRRKNSTKQELNLHD